MGTLHSEGQELYCLRELLSKWGVSEHIISNMPDCWRAKIVPHAQTDEVLILTHFTAKLELLKHVLDGTPVVIDQKYGQRAFDKVGNCALKYLCQDRKTNVLPKPKIAFLGGWGGPGTDVSSEEYLSLVHHFSDVVDPSNKTPKNLQMFHRDDHPDLPILPKELQWPLPDVLGDESNDIGVTVDMATRVSQRGAITWWHLDDGGEFVLQVGLPLDPSCQKNACLWGEIEKPIVKIFIFADKLSYKYIMQDKESNKTGRSACLDLFNTPAEYLPGCMQTASKSVQDAHVLPQFWVAPLVAGGYPLLSPPNVPHMVLTVQDCVMIEERRISKLFLDEVEYFMTRAALWAQPPILYDFIQSDLQDSKKTFEDVIDPLLNILTNYSNSNLQDNRIAIRICCSLNSLLQCGHFCQLSEAEHKDTIDKIQHFTDLLEHDAREKYRDLLYTDIKHEGSGFHKFKNEAYAAVVHEKGCPRWGPLRQTPEEALKDRKKLRRACAERKLHAALLELYK